MAGTMDRRTALKTGGLALAGAAAAPLGAAAAAADAGPRTRRFAPMDVRPERVVGEVVGLRPYRASGYVVRAEPLGDKTLVHNYGHGGCGTTLSWGTAMQAARLALETEHRQAAVIGAGAVGLATARLLQDRGFRVAVYAERLPPETTSNVSAALFGVTEVAREEEATPAFRDALAEAARFAHARFPLFIGGGYGVRWIEFFLLSDGPVEHPWDWRITPELYPLTRYPAGTHPFPKAHVASFPGLFIETQTYLPRVLGDVIDRGGTVTVRAFRTPDDLAALPEPLIVNCTGLGAHAIFGDAALVPLKGQYTKIVPQPEVDYVYLDVDADLYMFPRSDGSVLGGSHALGDWSLEPDPQRRAEIMAGHRRLVAGMD